MRTQYLLAGTLILAVVHGRLLQAETPPPSQRIGYTELRTNLPGGRHANVRTMRAVVSNIDGTGRAVLAEDLAREADTWTQFAGWSPDGKTAIVGRGWQSPENARWEEEHKQFRHVKEGWLYDSYLVELASGKAENVTAVERVSFYNSGLFFWPGDATKLGFTALIDGNSHPFRMDRDGRNKLDLTKQSREFAYGFSTSPDGKRIAYHKNYQVFLANADGSDAIQIKTGRPFNFVPTWSPDGQWVLFLSGEHYNCHPHVVRADGTGLKKLADRGGYKGVIDFLDVPDFHGGSSDTPVWSTDGKAVFYTALVGKSVELFRSPLEGKPEQLTKSPDGTLHYHPQPSPDGKSLAYGAKRDGVRQLYIMRLADGAETRITNLQAGHAAMWAHWQPMVKLTKTSAAQPKPPEGEPRLLGHWRLAGDGEDASGNGLRATIHDVRFTQKGPDGKTPAATFNGKGSHLHVAAAKKLKLGRGDFTIALWMHTPAVLDDDLGDLVTLYDAKKRIGFNLTLRNNTGVTTCQANNRQLQFGIDAGSEPKWIDEGRPGNAVFPMAMAVHDGKLYVGTSANGKEDVGRVYRHEGADRWIDCGAPDKCNAVSALAVHQGKMYAGSSKYRYAGSSLPESENTHRGGGIYRYEGGTSWTDVGRLPETEAVGGLVVYQGRLHASSLYKPAGFFRYEAERRWTSLPVPDGKRVEALTVFNGHLWASSYDGGRVYRYDGKDWKDVGQLGDNTQTYSFAVQRGKLCVGTWPSGKVYRWEEGSWQDLGRLGKELEVMGMLVHNGQLYAGTLPLAEVYRFDGGQVWTRLTQLDKTPDVRYRRAWTMAQHQGRLFVSTLPSGKIHSLQAGPCVTHDRELPPGWRHVAAVRQGGMLRLYVDGQQVAESAPFEPDMFNLSTDEPLLIGAGPGDFFAGALANVRLYAGALSAAQIARLSTP